MPWYLGTQSRLIGAPGLSPEGGPETTWRAGYVGHLTPSPVQCSEIGYPPVR